MKLPAIVIVSCALWGGCAHNALLDPRYDDFPGTVRPVDPDSPVGRDIAAGYRAYYALLATLGEWSSDPAYGRTWCPKGFDELTFVPYRSHGHWSAAYSETGAATWEVTSGPPWEELTLHHGWWVHQEMDLAPGRWCWVPGAESTPGNVAWRTGDGFVGWAPEPPPTEVDDVGDDTLEWVFEFEGTLFDDDLDDGILLGDAVDAARDATRASRQGRHGHHRAQGPSRSEVDRARRGLTAYAAAHPQPGRVAAQPGVAREPAHPVVGKPETHSGVEERNESRVTRLPPSMELYSRIASDSSHESSHAALPRIPAESFHASSTERGSSGFAGGRGSGGETSGYIGHVSTGYSGGGYSGVSTSGHGYSGGTHGSSSSTGGGGCGGAHTTVARSGK
jgi:hypothetical protein